MDSFHHWLMKAHLGFRKKVMATAQKYDLTLGQPKILEYLDEVGSSEQKSIARFCEIEEATVGSILKRMEQSGLITRQRDKDNRRSILVTLTDKGRQSAQRVQLLFDEVESCVLDGIDDSQQAILRDMLRKVYHNLQKTEEE